jgi:hypothetical protein
MSIQSRTRIHVLAAVALALLVTADTKGLQEPGREPRQQQKGALDRAATSNPTVVSSEDLELFVSSKYGDLRELIVSPAGSKEHNIDVHLIFESGASIGYQFERDRTGRLSARNKSIDDAKIDAHKDEFRSDCRSFRFALKRLPQPKRQPTKPGESE